MSSGTPRASDREQLLARLLNLRTIVPVFAKELASARRQAAGLRAENRRLLEQVRRLQRQHVVTRPTRAAGRRGPSPHERNA